MLAPPASPPRTSPELPNTSLNMPSTSTSGLEMMSTPTTTAKAILGNAGKQVNGTYIAPVPSAQIYTRKTKGASSNGVPPMKKTHQNGGLDTECVRANRFLYISFTKFISMLQGFYISYKVLTKMITPIYCLD
jgi:hypothetical protein